MNYYSKIEQSSKLNYYTLKIKFYGLNLFPIMIYDFLGFSDDKDGGMSDGIFFLQNDSDRIKRLD